jgi:hypothetical protein
MLAVTVAAAVAAGPASAQGSRIANGQTTRAWPEVGALVVGNGLCTATFVGCRTALTAAHCVCLESGTGPLCGDGTSLVDASELAIFVPQGGLFAVRAISVPLDFAFAEQGDVAVLSLDVPLRRIRPRAINEQARPPIGTTATIAGFGGTLQDSSGSGLLRGGLVTTAACLHGIGSSHVCWNLVPPLDLPGLESNTCPGDSGGPLLADIGAGVVLAGVHSGGFGSQCHVEDSAFDTDVFVESAWIRAQAGVDLDAAACGDGAQVGDPAVETIGFDGIVSTAVSHAFAVPSGTKLLRVGSTAIAGRGVELYVRDGALPTTQAFDCASSLSSTFGYCDIENPAVGMWFVRLEAPIMTSPYQVTATLLPADPGPPSPAADEIVVSNFTSFELVRIDLATGDRVVSSSNLLGAGAPLTSPEGIARDEDGSILVASPAGELLRVDPVTGDRIVVSGCADVLCNSLVGTGPAFLGPRFVALPPHGQILVADRSFPGTYAIVRVDPDTGARTTLSGCTSAACSTIVGTGPAISRLFGIALGAPDPPGPPGELGPIFVADERAVYEIDPVSGDRTLLSGCPDAGCAVPVGAGPAFGEPADLVVAPDGTLLVPYRIEGSLFGSLRRIDVATGERELVSGCENLACSTIRGSGPAFAEPFGVGFDRDGRLLVTDSRLDALLLVDLATGDRTLLSGCGDPTCQSAVGSGPRLAQPLDIAIVPEPSAASAMLAVLLTLLAMAAWASRETARARRARPISSAARRQ